MVHAATPTSRPNADPRPGNRHGSSNCRLRSGPFARSKRLRMVRTVHEPHRAGAVRARRARRPRRTRRGPSQVELVGRRRDATVHAIDDALHYGGRLLTGAVLQRVLDDEVEHGSEALVRIAGD